MSLSSPLPPTCRAQTTLPVAASSFTTKASLSPPLVNWLVPKVTLPVKSHRQLGPGRRSSPRRA
jgi:hypothetical protein